MEIHRLTTMKDNYPVELFNKLYKETKSSKWTFMSFLIPTAIAIGVTWLIATIVRAFGWV